MKVLFDQGTPVPRRRFLSEHTVTTAYEAGWSTLKNGDLLSAAAADGFEVLVTTDQNFSHQHSVATLALAIIVLSSTSWPKIQSKAAEVADAVKSARTGSVVVVTI